MAKKKKKVKKAKAKSRSKKKVRLTKKSLGSKASTAKKKKKKKGIFSDSDTKPQGDDLLTDNLAAKIYADDASKATGDAD